MAETNIIGTIKCALCEKLAVPSGIHDGDIKGPLCRECVMTITIANKVLRDAGFSAVTHDPAHER